MSNLLWYLDRDDLTGGELALAWVVGILVGIVVAGFLLGIIT